MSVRVKMVSMIQILIALNLLFLFSQAFPANSPPFFKKEDSRAVYLQANGSIPTGHFNIKTLKNRAVQYDQFEWLWLRDSRGQTGWVLKSAVLLPLDFSRQAVLPRGKALYQKPYIYEIKPKRLPRPQIVTLMGRHRNWYSILYKDGDKKLKAWVDSKDLEPYSKDGGYFFSKTKTWLRKEPKNRTKIITSINPGQPIIPLRAKGDWVLVSFSGHRGYIPFRNLKTRLDLALKVKTDRGYFKPHPSLHKQKILEIFVNPLWLGTGTYSLEVKSKPDMGSKTVSIIPPWQSMTMKGYSVKRWGKSQVPGWGQLWWPESTIESNVEVVKKYAPRLTILKRSEIYQIKKSPLIPGLVFASTIHGIYRSFDGQSWYPLKGFNGGMAVKTSRNGALFIGDKVSFDHGESFHHFIRWDRLLDRIPKTALHLRGPVELLNVQPNFNDHKKVTLSLKVGKRGYLRFKTADFGQNWSLQ